MIYENGVGDAISHQEHFPDRSLKPRTLDFFEELSSRQRNELSNYFLLGQISGDPDQDRPGGMRSPPGSWANSFINRFLHCKTTGQIDFALDPWRRWMAMYDAQDEGEDPKNQTAIYTSILCDLEGQRGQMSEKHFLYNVDQYLLRFTKFIYAAHEILEGYNTPIDAYHIFVLQGLSGKPYWPQGGLLIEEREKPDIKRLVVDDKQFVHVRLLRPEDEISTLEENQSSDVLWQRWGMVHEGTPVKLIKRNKQHGKENISIHSGTVVGWDGWSFIREEGFTVGIETNIGSIAAFIRDTEGFLHSIELRDLRLDTEEIGQEDLLPITSQERGQKVVLFQPKTGKSIIMNSKNEGDIVDFIVRQIGDIIKEESETDVSADS